ncbi:MAG TPA: tRNA (adenosine(37)-N6)-dimethylallyltransferase MiaA [Rhizomicrobium sp.]|jgi:tRNA dimethylallyltransferase
MIWDAVLVAGPTAGGKSKLALALARKFAGTLVNTDSMQVYREARILTARPDEADIRHAPHRLYGHVGVREPYSAAHFGTDASLAYAEARERGRLPIFVGGSGLYFSALTRGLANIPPVPDAVRRKVRARRALLGADAFFAEFAARDPKSAARLRASDTQRVLRAAEVLEASGQSISEWQRVPGSAPLSGARLARLVLSPTRSELHRRIDSRFESMIAAGALDEAASLRGLDPALPAAKILGLRELWAVLDGSMDLSAAKAAVKTGTRQYAKRQRTWFRHRMADWTWIEADETDAAIEQVLAQMG